MAVGSTQQIIKMNKIQWIETCTGYDLYIDGKKSGSITTVVTDNQVTFLVEHKGSYPTIPLAKNALLELLREET